MTNTLTGGGGGRSTDVSLAPFEKHPATTGELAGLTARLGRLADRAVDLDAMTGQRLAPALASWDGLAAPELRAAPQPVRDRAARSAGALAWASGPLGYWSEQVRLFNEAVNRINDERTAARGNNWGVPRGVTGLEHEVALAYAAHERTMRDRWWSAYHTYIDEGSRTAASMLREGPTVAHLSTLAAAGVWADPTDSMTVFQSFFHDLAMRRQALELAELIERINDPTYRPTLAELQLLEQILSDYASDEAFAYHLLSALGPEQFLLLAGNVAVLQVDDGWHFEDDVAALVGSIQANLGVALATATTRRGTGFTPGQHELPPEWTRELLRLGEQRLRLEMPHDNFGWISGEVYGYQILGVLLQAPEADWDGNFLKLVGNHMLDFEMDSGGTALWHDSIGGSVGIFPIQLNWIEGGAGNAGNDPVIGLLTALEREPEAARDLFANRVLYDGHPGGRLPLVDYLLTERFWIPDDSHGGDPPDPYALLGRTFETAVLDDPASRESIRLVESIVHELYTDLSGNDMVPPTMRESVANLLDPYVADLNRLFSTTNPQLDGQLGAFFPDGRGPGAEEYRVQLDRLLTDLGKDEQAALTITEAQARYVDDALRHYLSDPDMPVEDRLTQLGRITSTHAEISTALDKGMIRDWDEATAAELAAINERNRLERGIVNSIISHTVGQVPVVGSLAADGLILGLGDPATAEIDQGERDRIVGALREDSLSNTRDLVSAVIVTALPPDDPGFDQLLPGLPDQLREATENGRAWTQSDWNTWYSYLDGNPQVAEAVDNAVSEYAGRFPER